MTRVNPEWCDGVRLQFADLTDAQGPALVLFDLDGTLIDSVPDLASAVDAMLLGLNREPAGAELVRLWVGNGSEMLIRRALAKGVESATAELADDLLAQARVLFDDGYFAALHQATGVYPGVEACLQRLEALKIPVALVTNKPRRFTLPLLESLGWSERFNAVVCGDDLPQKKPLPDPLLYACQQLAIPASEALMVGDSRNDIGAAKAAGMTSVAVPYGYNHGEAIELCEPGCVVQQLDELVGLNCA